jgi:hypothetical protein
MLICRAATAAAAAAAAAGTAAGTTHVFVWQQQLAHVSGIIADSSVESLEDPVP